jgi:perosamine synthetase
LLEDCAESFSGLDYIGHPLSDLTFLSFGAIKVATSFGGGLGRMRSSATAAHMAQIQQGWEVQQRSMFIKKCLKGSLAILALNVPLFSGGIMRSSRAVGIDHKSLVVALLRGFPDRLMERLRESPHEALLTVMHHRLSHFDESDFQHHQDLCDTMLELLPPSVLRAVPGLDAEVRNHWLFPVRVEHVEEVLRELNAKGVDAYRGATQLALVRNLPEETNTTQVGTPLASSSAAAVSLIGASDHPAPIASDVMEHVIYLPVHKRVPLPVLVQMAVIVHQVVEQMERKYGKDCEGIPLTQQIKSKL